MYIEIEYTDGSINRGIKAYTIEMENLKDYYGYNLRVYPTLDDWYRQIPIIYKDVKKITVMEG